MGSFDHWGFLTLIWRVYFKDKVDIKTEIYSSSDNSSDISLTLTLMFSCNRHTSLFKLLKKYLKMERPFSIASSLNNNFLWLQLKVQFQSSSYTIPLHVESHMQPLESLKRCCGRNTEARFGMSLPFYDANRNFLCSLSSLDYQIVHWDHRLLKIYLLQFIFIHTLLCLNFIFSNRN